MIVLDYVLGYPRIILELFSVLFLKESLCDLEQPNYKKANRDVFFFCPLESSFQVHKNNL